MDPIDLGPHHRLHEGLRGMQGSRLVFVNSRSDLFYPDIPAEFIHRVFAVMNDMQQHTYQVLTKRADRLLELNDRLNWTPNIWMGASVEDRRDTRRIDLLLQSREAEVTFFFKQWGGNNKKRSGRLMGGNVYDEMPLWPARSQIRTNRKARHRRRRCEGFE